MHSECKGTSDKTWAHIQKSRVYQSQSILVPSLWWLNSPASLCAQRRRQVYLGRINSVPFVCRLLFSEQLLFWLIVYVLPLHLKITLPFDTNGCPRHACVKAQSSYLHLIPKPKETGDWVPPCEQRLRVITILEQPQAKLIMWVQWYFYWITFSCRRQGPSNPPRPTFFSPSINNLLWKDAWLLQAQVRVTLRVQHRQWTRSRCTAGRGKALLSEFAFLTQQLKWQALLYFTLSHCSSETTGSGGCVCVCVKTRKGSVLVFTLWNCKRKIFIG